MEGRLRRITDHSWEGEVHGYLVHIARQASVVRVAHARRGADGAVLEGRLVRPRGVDGAGVTGDCEARRSDAARRVWCGGNRAEGRTRDTFIDGLVSVSTSAPTPPFVTLDSPAACHSGL